MKTYFGKCVKGTPKWPVIPICVSDFHWLHFLYTGIAYFIALHRYYVFFKDWKFVATLCPVNLLTAIFPTVVFQLCVFVSHFGNSWNILNFVIITVFVVVICDQWFLLLLLQLFWGASELSP